MSNPTTNYSFQMPTSSDLVTDLPADFEVFGQAVDTQIKNLNPETTLGDISYRSSTANTNTRLAIGTTGQVLTVSGGVPAWGSAAAPADTWTLLSTVTLNGLSSTTISGITSNKIILYLVGGRNATGVPDLMVRPNNSTTAANYKQSYVQNTALGGANYIYTYDGSVDKFIVGSGDDGNTSIGLWYQLENCKSTSYKISSSIGGSRASGAGIMHNRGAYVETAAVTSITVLLSSSSFNAGTLYVYGA